MITIYTVVFVNRTAQCGSIQRHDNKKTNQNRPKKEKRVEEKKRRRNSFFGLSIVLYRMLVALSAAHADH